MFSKINIHVANTMEDFQRVYALLRCVRAYYPGFDDWFWKKVISNIYTKKRTILLAKNMEVGDIAGISIVKNDEEKKICTFFIADEYRNNGLGTILMNTTLDCLQCDAPLITVSEDLISDFANLLQKFNFEPIEVYAGYYVAGKLEYAYNGHLVKEKSKVIWRIAA